MNVEIETEAAQFPEKEYINGIFLAVCVRKEPRNLILLLRVHRHSWKEKNGRCCNPTVAYAGHTWYSDLEGWGKCYSVILLHGPASYNNTNSDQDGV